MPGAMPGSAVKVMWARATRGATGGEERAVDGGEVVGLDFRGRDGGKEA